VQVHMACDPDLPMVEADPILIEQVVVNLVRNACDALSVQDGDALPKSERPWTCL
jgi:two-component system sensor histidine kinase DctS